MVRINDEYVIDVDEMNYTVKIDMHKKNKKGEDVYKTVGYYTTMKNALDGVVNNRIARKLLDKDYSLEEALTTIRTIHQEYIDVYNKVLQEY